jgi:aconitate hydratase
VFQGALQPWVTGKDLVLELLRRWGAKQSQGMSVEFVDAGRQLPIAFRNTICNMMAEAESWNGTFAPDDVTYEWFAAKGMKDLPYPRIAPGADVDWAIDEVMALPDVRPMIAKPFSPGNAFPAEEVAGERITFDKAMIGSCTNGGYDDLLSAALVLKAARARGLVKAAKEFVIFPGSGGVKRQIEQPDPRLDGESIAEVFRSVGGLIRQSWCGPCFGQGPDAWSPRARCWATWRRPRTWVWSGSPRRSRFDARGDPGTSSRGDCTRFDRGGSSRPHPTHLRKSKFYTARVRSGRTITFRET